MTIHPGKIKANMFVKFGSSRQSQARIEVHTVRSDNSHHNNMRFLEDGRFWGGLGCVNQRVFPHTYQQLAEKIPI